MSDAIEPTIVYVSYQGPPGARFEKGYYVEDHLPLVMREWSRYGLEGVAAFFPSSDQAGPIAICECRFRDDAAMRTAFASPEASTVMADLPSFTDLQPRRFRAVPLTDDPASFLIDAQVRRDRPDPVRASEGSKASPSPARDSLIPTHLTRQEQ